MLLNRDLCTTHSVRKVKHSSVRIENLLLDLCVGDTEYFSLARTFQMVWGGGGTGNDANRDV